jgi:hypothetical protein
MPTVSKAILSRFVSRRTKFVSVPERRQSQFACSLLGCAAGCTAVVVSVMVCAPTQTCLSFMRTLADGQPRASSATRSWDTVSRRSREGKRNRTEVRPTAEDAARVRPADDAHVLDRPVAQHSVSRTSLLGVAVTRMPPPSLQMSTPEPCGATPARKAFLGVWPLNWLHSSSRSPMGCCRGRSRCWALGMGGRTAARRRGTTEREFRALHTVARVAPVSQTGTRSCAPPMMST